MTGAAFALECESCRDFKKTKVEIDFKQNNEIYLLLMQTRRGRGRKKTKKKDRRRV